MIPPDRAFEEGSAKSNNDFKTGVGVLGLVSVCLAVFVIFLCAKKDGKSIRKKPSTESSQDLLENQVSPARHGINNMFYVVTENGIGEPLDQNETSVLHQSLPMRGEGRSQNSSPESSHSPTSTPNNALANQQQALYDSPTSNKPIQTMSTESKNNQIFFERRQLEEHNHSLSSDENLASSGGKGQDSADELYLVPKPNKSRNEKKPLPSPKLLEKPKKKRPDASDSEIGVRCELANTTCNYGTSTHPLPKLIKKVDLKKDDDTHDKPLTKMTQEKIIAFSSSREGKLSESESGIDENKFQYEFPKMTKLEGEANSPLSNKINQLSVILSSSKSNGLSTIRTTPDENNSDCKKYTSKEANSKNNLHKLVPGKQVQNGQTKLKKKPELVSSRGRTIDDDESYNGRLSNASDINSSHGSIEDDPSMYINVCPFPAEDLPPPPPPCHFSYGDVPKTMASKQNLSLTRYVNSEPEDHPDYTNCAGFSKRDNNLKLMETNCPPAPCCMHKYINISHTPSKELEEDNEYVAMNTHDNLDSQSTNNYVAKYANIQDSHVRLTPESDRDMYLLMTKHLAHANSDTCLYQNGGNTKLKENKYIYVNSSFSIESTQKCLHENEQDDVYSYASADFFFEIQNGC